MDRPPSKVRRCGLLIRNVFIATVAYTSVVGVVQVFRTGSLSLSSSSAAKPIADSTEGTLSGGVNWKLRPDTLVQNINDAFLGPRPDVDTFANYSRLLEACRGSPTGLEKMRNVFNCLDYLTNQE